MYKTVIGTLLLLIFVSSFSVQAGILIEPYLGYSINGEGINTNSDQKYESEYSSLTYGGRLGYQYMGLMLGLDYSLQSFEAETKHGEISKENIEKNQIGVFVGYKLPLLFRVWGTYYIGGELEGTDSFDGLRAYSKSDKITEGSGFALGIGYEPLPFMSINLEYRTIEYDKWEFDGTPVDQVSELPKFTEILLSASIPLDI